MEFINRFADQYIVRRRDRVHSRRVVQPGALDAAFTESFAMEEKYKIHAGYIFSILVFIIIALITVKWSEIANLSGYLTFSLTVTSLVLSVVAIFYTIYSNAGFAGKLTELSGASEKIADAAADLSRTSTEIRSKVEGIPQVLKDVGERVQEAHLLIKTFSEVESRPVGREKGEQKVARPVDETYVTSVLTGTSAVGVIVLYVCLLSSQKKVPFDLSDLWGKLKNIVQEPYALGYIVGFTPTGLMKSTQTKGIINVTAFDETLAGKVKAELDKRVEAMPTPEGKKIFLANIATIEAYFPAATKASPTQK